MQYIGGKITTGILLLVCSFLLAGVVIHFHTIGKLDVSGMILLLIWPTLMFLVGIIFILAGDNSQ